MDPGAPATRYDELQGLRTRQEGYAFLVTYRTGESALYLPSRRVAVVQDARRGVGGLKGEVQSLEPVRVAVEGYLEVFDQEPPYERRSLP
jgi:hypothetical protein